MTPPKKRGFLLFAFIFIWVIIALRLGLNAVSTRLGDDAQMIRRLVHKGIIMGIASHLGPWLLGTVKDTTGTTVGSIRNMGATVVSQTKKINFTGTTVATPAVTNLFTIPAGAQINHILIDTLVAFTGSTAANIVIGTAASTALFWASTDVTAQGRLPNTGGNTKLADWCGAATAASPNGAGVGATDVLIQSVLSPTVATVTAGTVQITIMYTVANSNGSQTPVSA